LDQPLNTLREQTHLQTRQGVEPWRRLRMLPVGA
jgi:hypothetical protein